LVEVDGLGNENVVVGRLLGEGELLMVEERKKNGEEAKTERQYI